MSSSPVPWGTVPISLRFQTSGCLLAWQLLGELCPFSQSQSLPLGLYYYRFLLSLPLSGNSFYSSISCLQPWPMEEVANKKFLKEAKHVLGVLLRTVGGGVFHLLHPTPHCRIIQPRRPSSLSHVVLASTICPSSSGFSFTWFEPLLFLGSQKPS